MDRLSAGGKPPRSLSGVPVLSRFSLRSSRNLSALCGKAFHSPNIRHCRCLRVWRKVLQLPQQLLQRVNRQVRGVTRGFRQSTNFTNQLFPGDGPRRVDRVALDQFGDCRSARDRRDAAFGAKANVGDRPLVQLHAQLQNISTRRILQPRPGIGLFHGARVSRMREMVEEFSGVHSAILNALAPAAPTVLSGFLHKHAWAGLV